MQSLLTEFGEIKCEAIRDGITVDPVAPPLLCDPHRRSEEEIKLWYRRPYVIGRDGKWDLFCLQGSGYSATLWGTFDTLDSAISEATTHRPPHESSGEMGDLNF